MTIRHRSLVRYLAIYGCIATGIIYLAIGVIAILSFLKIKHGGADENSLLAYLNNFIAGTILIWIILLGTISYIAWRIYETIRDPYGYGSDWKGMATRAGIGLSTVADGLIAYSAILALLGTSPANENGRPEQQRETVSHILQKDWGDSLIITIGAVIAVTAVVQFIYGIARGYKERLNIQRLSRGARYFVHFLAWAGYCARGIILGIIGFFLIKAGAAKDAQYVVNTDKAFDFIGDDVGHFYFILTAAGTICYGLFMFALGMNYDSDKG